MVLQKTIIILTIMTQAQIATAQYLTLFDLQRPQVIVSLAVLQMH